MVLIHQVISKTPNRRSDLATRDKVVKPVESYWEIVPNQAMKKSNGPLSVRWSVKSCRNGVGELTGALEAYRKGQQR